MTSHAFSITNDTGFQARFRLLCAALLLNACIFQTAFSVDVTVGPVEVVMSGAERAATGVGFFIDTNMGVLRSGSQYTFFSAGGGAAYSDGQTIRTIGTLAHPAASSAKRCPTLNLKENFQYLGGGPVYRDPQTGTLILFYGYEVHDQGSIFGRITDAGRGLAKSTNGGDTWTDLGRIISSATPTPYPVVSGEENENVFSNGQYPFVVAGDYFYCYTREHAGDLSQSWIGVVRARISDVMSTAINSTSAAPWSKFYQGSWNQPGIRGQASPLWTEPRGTSMSRSLTVSWNRALGQYIAMGTNEFDSKFYMRQSPDGLNWNGPQAIAQYPSGATTGAYISIVGLEDEPRDSGTQFYIYHMYGAPGVPWGDNAMSLVRQLVSLGSSPAPTPAPAPTPPPAPAPAPAPTPVSTAGITSSPTALVLTVLKGQNAVSTLALSKTGADQHSYYLSTNQSWIVMNPPYGSTQTISSETDRLEITALTANFSVGTYSAVVYIVDSGPNNFNNMLRVPVTVTVSATSVVPGPAPAPAPVPAPAPAPTPTPVATAGIITNPMSLALTVQKGQNAVGTLALSKAGTNQHSYYLSTNQSWILMNPPYGSTQTISTETDQLVITAQTADLAFGSYSAVVYIVDSGPNNFNNMLRVPVTLTVTATPVAPAPAPAPTPAPAPSPTIGKTNTQIVQQLYLDLLGRPADDGGLAYYVGWLDRGYTVNDVRGTIVSGTECTAAINDLYKKAYGRDATSAEIAAQKAYLNGGGTLTGIALKLGLTGVG